MGKSGGCFPGGSLVETENGGRKRLDEVRLGERIAALDPRTGDVVYSEVIAFLDRSPSERRQFVRLTTASGRALTLTPAHLVPAEGRGTVFAARVRAGDRILVSDDERPGDAGDRQARTQRQKNARSLRWDYVTETKLVLEKGVYAPLTAAGTLLVDDVVASCYAVVDSQSVAHYAFLPLRIWNSVTSFLTRRLDDGDLATTFAESRRRTASTVQQGVHWYASMLYSLSSYVLPSKMIYDN